MTDRTRADRQAASARMPQCKCGNTARSGSDMCRGCEEVEDEAQRRIDNLSEARQALRNALYDHQLGDKLFDALDAYIDAKIEGNNGPR